jgi:BASS family bile acid:Na+ symporter
MNKSRLLLIAALVSIVVGLILVFSGQNDYAAPFFVGCFVLLAFGFQGYKTLKGFSYTAVIFAGVTLALFYPGAFNTWNGFKLSLLITPLIQLIMFGMGTSMSFMDFVGVVKMPKGVFIGVVSHFIIMPLLGYTLANLSGFPPEIAAGIILIGCSPNGMASNVISYLAKANLALSLLS